MNNALKHVRNKIIKILMIIAPAIWGVFVVYNYGVNVSFCDEWEYIMTYKNGVFHSIGYLLAQHNEHRMFFPKIITYVVGRLFAWNSKAFMYFGIIMLILLYLIVILVFCRCMSVKFNTITYLQTVQLMVLGFSVFNLCQLENMLWGFQTAWFMIVLFATLSFFLFQLALDRNKQLYFWLSMISAFVTSFSSMHGLAIWPAYFIVIIALFIIHRKIPLSFVVGYFFTAVFSVLLYFHNYHSVSYHSSFMANDSDTIMSVFFRQIGATLVPAESNVAGLCGFFLLILFVCVIVIFYLRNWLNGYIDVISPMIMAAGMMLMIAIGRGADGSLNIASRYTTNSAMFLTFLLLSVFVILHRISNDGMTKTDHNSLYGLVSIVVVLSAMVIFRNIGNIDDASEMKEDRLYAQQLLLDYEEAPAEEIATYFCPQFLDAPDQLTDSFEFLKINHYNAFIHGGN